MRANEDIRAACKKAGVRQWEVAEAIGRNEYWLTKHMRRELPGDLKEQILEAITRLSKEKEVSV